MASGSVPRPELGRPVPVHQAEYAEPEILRRNIEGFGITAVKQVLAPEWGMQVHADSEQLFAEAMNTDRGAADRGKNRYYFAVHPERLSGFREMMDNPVFNALNDTIFGHDWQLVEVGFDVNRPGSRYQFWHRDFGVPKEVLDEGRVTSLAYNFSTVKVTPEMGPFEVVTGTQFDHPVSMDGRSRWIRGMFPTPDFYDSGYYDRHKQNLFGDVGNMSVRFASGIHHGTPNTTPHAGPLPDDRYVPGDRPVLIVGVIPKSEGRQPHPLQFSREYYESLPADMKTHLEWAHVTDTLRPIVQTHEFEGLMMGNNPSSLPEVKIFRSQMARRGWET